MRGAGVEENGAASGARLWVNSLGALALDERTGGSSEAARGLESVLKAGGGFFKLVLSLRGKVHGFPLALVDEYKGPCLAS